MTLGGLWHGANWTFVIWGLLHGVGIGINHLFRSTPLSTRTGKFIGTLLTFHFVTFGWIFFRSRDLATVFKVLAMPFVSSWANLGGFVSANSFGLVLMATFLVTHHFDSYSRIRLIVKKLPLPFVVAAIAFCWILAIAVSSGNTAEFIYFDF